MEGLLACWMVAMVMVLRPSASCWKQASTSAGEGSKAGSFLPLPLLLLLLCCCALAAGAEAAPACCCLGAGGDGRGPGDRCCCG